MPSNRSDLIPFVAVAALAAVVIGFAQVITGNAVLPLPGISLPSLPSIPFLSQIATLAAPLAARAAEIQSLPQRSRIILGVAIPLACLAIALLPFYVVDALKWIANSVRSGNTAPE